MTIDNDCRSEQTDSDAEEEKDQRRLEASLDQRQKQLLVKLARKEFFECSSIE